MALSHPHPTTQLPEGYVEKGCLDLAKNMTAMLLMNLLGLVLAIGCGWGFLAFLVNARPALFRRDFSISVDSGVQFLAILAMLAFVTVAVIVLHEGVHGFFFHLFTGHRPKFGIGPGYAYAAAPGWYIPRNQYLVVALAPFLLLSLLGLILLTWLPPAGIPGLLLFLVLNDGGAAGDLAVAAWLLTQPASCLAQDTGQAIVLYRTNSENPSIRDH